MANIATKEPVGIGFAVVGVVAAALPVLTLFGIEIGEEQQVALNALTVAVVTLVTAVVIRGKVTPVNNPDAEDEYDEDAGIDYEADPAT